MADSRIKYDPLNHPRLVKYMTRCGAIDTKIAEELGIHVDTLNKWKKKYPELSESLKESKNFVDSLVEDSLLKRALGFEYTETEEWTDDKGNLTKTKTTKKRTLPDTTAQIFWLKNRQRDRWKDRWDIGFDEDSPFQLVISNKFAPKTEADEGNGS